MTRRTYTLPRNEYKKDLSELYHFKSKLFTKPMEKNINKLTKQQNKTSDKWRINPLCLLAHLESSTHPPAVPRGWTIPSELTTLTFLWLHLYITVCITFYKHIFFFIVTDILSSNWVTVLEQMESQQNTVRNLGYINDWSNYSGNL